ncbi:DUF3304 domain-containing protein [Cupriavidus sp. D384]|uniref:DUF3304 domain-containing protein n=1 Tax=Cupriavidus sp. D384 TaxID=1538095 RepID=UPI000B2637B5|nr:DUF3304 domain-containing protein [Cupriavidus sp. D384]
MGNRPLSSFFMKRRFGVVPAILTGLAVTLAGCTGVGRGYERPSKYLSGGVMALNYTPYYIHRINIEGPDPVRGGGPNVMPAEPGKGPSGGGKESCCLTYPRQWQPELRVTVRWLVEKVKDGKTPGYWYKAENVSIPQYDGTQTGGAWSIFLPGDRVKLMIADGNANGRNSVDRTHTADDPDVFQGVRDDEWNLKYRKGGLQ